MTNKWIVLAVVFAVTAILGPCAITLLKKMKFRQTERAEGPQSHLKKQGTPTMGGIMFMPVVLAATAVSAFSIRGIWPLVAVVAAMFAVGMTDDLIKIFKNKNGLYTGQKTVLQLLVAVAYTVWLLTTQDTFIVNTLFVTIKLPMLLYGVFAVGFIYFVTNAVNLTDGVDGLASSVTVVAMAAVSMVLSITGGSEADKLFAFAVTGGCLGFLIYNKYPAKVFMGDTGSLALGTAFAVLMLKTGNPLLVLLIGIIYCAEAFSVMIQVTSFKLTKKRVFKMSPIHHHFELCGWSETKIVGTFTIVTLLGSMVAVILAYLGI